MRSRSYLASKRVLFLGSKAALSLASIANAAELPVPCAGNCGANAPAAWVSAGAAAGAINGNIYNINQTSQNVTLNWQSFNIGPDGSVVFTQPDANAVALNRIFQSDPTRIFGQLSANGQIYLINQNGIVFDRGAQVNVRGLIASTLDITPTAEQLGLTAPIQTSQPAFAAAVDAQGTLLSKDIRIEQGASIATPSGGRIFMFAPNVTNEGSITTPDGQTVLAAGRSIYLTAGSSGLLVEVNGGGSATNGLAGAGGAIGSITADRGAVSLVGLAVNQLGRISASTAVRQAGRIELKARNSTATGGGAGTSAAGGGQVTFGVGSITDVSPDITDTATTLDANPQPRGSILAIGNELLLQSGSQLNARSGTVSLNANGDGDDETDLSGTATASRIRIESESRIDVSGLTATLPAERNALTVKLQGDELKDRPVQRDGALYRQTVVVDLRRHGRLDDGTEWIGTPLADLRKAAAGVPRTVIERSTAGGVVDIQSTGDIVIAPGTVIDVSGGAVQYAGGVVQTTQLIRNGNIIDIGSADPDFLYDGIVGEVTVDHAKWGVRETFSMIGSGSVFASGAGGYVEGRDAGSIAIASPNLILEGDLRGASSRGELQRNPANADIARGLGRSFDEMPLGGRLIVGANRTGNTDFVTPNVSIERTRALSQLPGFNVVGDPFPDAVDRVFLSPDLFGNNAFSELQVFSNGRVNVAADTVLDLGRNGTLELSGTEANIDGKILSTGGEVSVFTRLSRVSIPGQAAGTGQLRIGAGALIDVSGEWVNDSPLLAAPNESARNPISIDAGSITLDAQPLIDGQGGLAVEQGSHLHADGGAHLLANSAMRAGKGGAITLNSHRSNPRGVVSTTVLDGEFTGYALEEGGTLSILAPDICISIDDCGAAVPGQIRLTPERFRSGGFSHFDFTAEGGGLTVARNTVVELQQRNFILSDRSLSTPSVTPLRSFAGIGLLEDFERHPVGLKLATTLVSGAQESRLFEGDRLLTAPFLSVGSGARIVGENGAALRLASNSRMVVDGELTAPGGQIDLLLDSVNLLVNEASRFTPAQTLWLGAGARLNAAGAVRLRPDARGLRSGDVFDGGSISLRARSGYIVAQSGSMIDVAAASEMLDVTLPGGGLNTVTRREAYGAAGSIQLQAAEGILFDGEMRAAGAAGGPDGSLRVMLDAQGRRDTGDQSVAATFGLPSGPRTVVLTGSENAVVPLAVQPGEALPDAINGFAILSAPRLERAGFGDIRLQARNLVRTVTNTRVPGAIRLEQSPSLQVSRRLEVIAAGIHSDGSVASLSAPYLAIGNDDDTIDGNNGFRLLPDLFGGDGRLSLDAMTLDILGNSRLLGLGMTELRASEDIRLRGLQIQGQPEISGSLESTGDLSFVARQIYPTTLSEFMVAVRDNPDGRIDIAAAAADDAPVLSVGGALTFQAENIAQGGAVKAPLGSITFDAAQRLDLLPGSVTSTSLEDQLALFGRVELGRDWIYSLEKNTVQRRLVFNSAGSRPADEFPSQQVVLRAPEISLKTGAVVDESGGGDLLAYEFDPGLGGTVDILDPDFAAGAFAVVPSLEASFAPIDPQEYVGFNIKPGSSIELADGVMGLPAGRYAILPPRYALLPGAFLVNNVSGYKNLPAGQVITPAGGGTLLSGRRLFADGTQAASASEGYLVRSRDELGKLASYNVYRANESSTLFDEARLPRDGGILQIAAGTTLELGGVLRSVPGTGGRGAVAEFTGNRLSIVATGAAGTATPGVVLLDEGGLNSLGAESLVLGATVQRDADDSILSVTAQSIVVESGVSLQAPELLLAATESVLVKSGSSISASGAGSGAADDLTVSGEGAILRASVNPQIDIRRDGVPFSPTQGTLTIEQGAVIAADRSVLLDSTLETRLDGSLEQSGGSLTLSTSRISLGTPPAPVSGLTLSQGDFAALSVRNLTLKSRNGIGMYGSLAGDFDTLVIDTPMLEGQGIAGDLIRFTADTVSLGNSSSPSNGLSAVGMGMLEIAAHEFSVGGGEIAISGFAATSLTATGDFLATSSSGGTIDVTGNLDLTAGRISGTAGASLAVRSSGVLRSMATGGMPVDAVTALGAEIALSGKSLFHTGRIVLPSGKATLRATGVDAVDGLTIDGAAVVDVSGVQLTFADRTVFTPAGDITLAAAAGNIGVNSGSTLDLSAAGEGAAGMFSVAAPAGTLTLDGTVKAGAVTAADSGRAQLDLGRLDSFSAVNATLNAGRFLAARELRVRSGDISVAAGDAVEAQRVKLAADQGGITVLGRIGSGAARAASIELDALGDIDLLSGAFLDARVSGAGNAGGHVNLNSAQGGVRIEAGAAIDVSPAIGAAESAQDVFAARGGRIDIRAPRTVAITLADADGANDELALGGTILGARAINVLAYENYTDTDGIIDFIETQADGSNLRYADAASFVQTYADAIRAGLGIAADDTRFHLRPGVAIATLAGQDMTMGADWDLSLWRFAGEPGELTLRSGRDLLFNSSLSDGFAGTADLTDTFTAPQLLTDESWSYRLVAGADFTSSDALSTAGPTGSLILAAGVPSTSNFGFDLRPQLKAIRTGTGSIDIAAAHEVILSNRASVIYTAGKDSGRGIPLGFLGETGTLEGRRYPTAGGSINLRAGGSVRGIDPALQSDYANYTNQLVTGWLYRQGSAEYAIFVEQAPAWTVAHEWFEQGIGALGGGDLSVVSGGDIDNLSLVIPTIGRQMGGTTLAASRLEIDGGGNLNVQAAGDIKSGVFYVARGDGSLEAGGGIVAGRSLVAGDATALRTIVLVDDGQLTLSARGNIDLETIANTTLLPQARPQRPLGSLSSKSYFSSYGESAGVSLTALVGDVTLYNGLTPSVLTSTSNPFGLDFDNSLGDEALALQLYAPVLEVKALQGDINLKGRFSLYPSAAGDVQLLAGNSIFIDDRFSLTDADPQLLPSIASPSTVYQPFEILTSGLPSFAARPLHATGSSAEPARLVALTGDIDYNGPSSIDSIFLAKPTLFYAGRDITNLNALIQNVNEGDISTIRVGRDLSYPFSRDANGSFSTGPNAIQIQGPGRLNIEVGRNMELGVFAGITSLGDSRNPALADGGAHISVTSGVGSELPAYAAFALHYMPERYRTEAIAYARGRTGNSVLSETAALAAFEALPAAERQSAIYGALSDAIYESFFAELRATGRANAVLGAADRDYSRGDLAVQTLFPAPAYAGDISLFFSRIYTLDGGNIDVMAPGGLLNVGLSTPPSGFGIRKAASELGLVAQSSGSVRAFLKDDFAVNESRVFAADGGDILVWSSHGNIDAGRGAKSSISAPPPVVSVDPSTGAVRVTFPPALTGSGIRTLTTTPGRAFGSVDLITPRGFVDASEAGIESQGNVTISAIQVLGVDNIKVGGVSTGVPVDTGGLGASLASVSSVASSANTAATSGMQSGAEATNSPLAEAALSWLDVFVLGYGEEVCKAEDVTCLKRNQKQ